MIQIIGPCPYEQITSGHAGLLFFILFDLFVLNNIINFNKLDVERGARFFSLRLLCVVQKKRETSSLLRLFSTQYILSRILVQIYELAIDLYGAVINRMCAVTQTSSSVHFFKIWFCWKYCTGWCTVHDYLHRRTSSVWFNYMIFIIQRFANIE